MRRFSAVRQSTGRRGPRAAASGGREGHDIQTGDVLEVLWIMGDQKGSMADSRRGDPCICGRDRGPLSGHDPSPFPTHGIVIGKDCVRPEMLNESLNLPISPTPLEGPAIELGHRHEREAKILVAQVLTIRGGESMTFQEVGDDRGVDDQPPQGSPMRSERRHRSTASSNPSSISSGGQPPVMASMDSTGPVPWSRASSSTLLLSQNSPRREVIPDRSSRSFFRMDKVSLPQSAKRKSTRSPEDMPRRLLRIEPSRPSGSWTRWSSRRSMTLTSSSGPAGSPGN